MKYRAELETERLILRNWTLSDQDRDFFHFILSNKTVRRFYITVLNRAEADARLEKLVSNLEKAEFDWGVACLKETGRPIGFTGICKVPHQTHFTPAVEIGWLYHPDVWGPGYASEAALRLVKHAFNDLDLPQVVAYAVHNNYASIGVMKRIGMKHIADGDFDHPAVPDTHPHLKHHVLYRLTQNQWLDRPASKTTR